VIVVPKLLPTSANQWVVFGYVFRNRIDVTRVEPVSTKGELVKFLRDALDYKNRPAADWLRYCFDYLQSADGQVAAEAYHEFARAPYSDYRAMAAKLDPDKIAGWLRDPATLPLRYGLYASLLSHCGNLEHAALLRKMLADPSKRLGIGIDGMLAGYCMLLHKEGKTADALTYLKGVLNEPKGDFPLRYAALRTVRFFWDVRPDVFKKDDLVAATVSALQHPDLADFVIEDLAKWRRWETTDQVLAYWDKQSHRSSVIKRAILRFMLRSPEKQAASFVREQERRDPEWVTDTREVLELSTPAQPTPPAKSASGR
jgi:hypothetical protein